MLTQSSLDLIRKHAIDRFVRYVDECIEEYNYKLHFEEPVTIDDVEEIWGTLIDQSIENISEIISSLVSTSDEDDLIQEVKKKRKKVLILN